jgi:hypothetical protein
MTNAELTSTARYRAVRAPALPAQSVLGEASEGAAEAPSD